jgi:hypothetical protein
MKPRFLQSVKYRTDGELNAVHKHLPSFTMENYMVEISL